MPTIDFWSPCAWAHRSLSHTRKHIYTHTYKQIQNYISISQSCSRDNYCLMKGKIGIRSLEGSWLSLAGSDAVPGKRIMATVDGFLYSDFFLS